MVDTYEGFKEEILKLSGIDLSAYKERQMLRRINSLIAKNGYKGYVDYTAELKKNKDLYEEFINYLTINVSEFYRNPEQWQTLEKEVFTYLFDKFGKRIKIWSAACSTGDEPYSLAMVLAKSIPIKDISITATDIDKNILSKAKDGIYSSKSLAGLPDEYKNKHFTKQGDFYRINDDIKSCIDFKQHNLLKDQYPSDMNLVVCRNVLIYFTEEAKIDIYKKFNRALKKEGILFVGSTEQILSAHDYKLEPVRSFFYKKIADV